MNVPLRIRPLEAACVLAVLTVLAAGCRDNPDRSAPAPGTPRSGATMTGQSDPGANTTAELLAADRAFAAAVAAAPGPRRTAVWTGWFAPDGRQLMPGAVVVGHDDIAALMGPAFADPAASLTWEPDQAGGGDDWGWTSGRYVNRRTGPDGPVTSEGRYLTVWQRQGDGAWKVAVDTGVPDRR